MTFREFIEARKTVDKALVSEIESDMLSKLRIEGFTDQEVYNMLMPRLWSLYHEVIGNYMEKAFSELAPAIEANPNLANNPALKKLQEKLKESLEELEKQEEKL